MRIEVEKTLRAHEIAKKTDLFYTPKVLNYNDTTGCIKFERLDHIRKMRSVITSMEIDDSIIRSLGFSLAAIHNELTLPDDMVLPLPQEYSQSGNQVFIHGDFNLGNIFLDMDNKRIIIMDWQSTYKVGEPATYDTRYFDLMWFIYNLFYRPLNHPRYRSGIPAASMAELFLYSYFKRADCEYDHKSFSAYMKKFFNTKVAISKIGHHSKKRFRLIPRKRYLQLMPSHRKLKQFISSFQL